jgi:hypothetical protein
MIWSNPKVMADFFINSANVPLILKVWDLMFFSWEKHIPVISHFWGVF